MTTALRSAGASVLAFSVTCGLVAALGAQPASARPLPNANAMSDEAISERVSVAGLNLARADHRRRVNNRIRSASRRVCEGPFQRLTSDTAKHCRRVAREDAEVQLAALVNRAERLAAAGMPTEINTVLTVIASGSE